MYYIFYIYYMVVHTRGHVPMDSAVLQVYMLAFSIMALIVVEDELNGSD